MRSIWAAFLQIFGAPSGGCVTQKMSLELICLRYRDRVVRAVVEVLAARGEPLALTHVCSCAVSKLAVNYSCWVK
jgi:hypothetical protein